MHAYQNLKTETKSSRNKSRAKSRTKSNYNHRHRSLRKLVTQDDIIRRADDKKTCIALSPILNPAKNDLRSSICESMITKQARESESRMSIEKLGPEMFHTENTPAKEGIHIPEQAQILTPQKSCIAIHTQIEQRYEEVSEQLRAATQNEHAIEF